MLSKQPLLVTGASGQLGQRVLTHLLDDEAVPGSQIIATTRHPERLASFAARGVQVRRGDFDAPEGLAAAFSGATRALLISTDRVDVPGLRLKEHLTAIETAVKAGVRHVVYTSMIHPDPDSPIPFAPDHYGTEGALAASSLTWTILRNNMYTDFLFQTLAPAIAEGRWFSAAGDLGTAFVTRDDCARACAAALASDATTKAKYDITGPVAVSNAQLVKMVQELTGKSISLIPVTADQFRAGLASAGLPPPIVELLVALDLNALAGHPAVVSDAIQKLTRKPPQSVSEFLAAHKAALSGQASNPNS
jgi:NAD(P)H dehydrogenase (quinone)